MSTFCGLDNSVPAVLKKYKADLFILSAPPVPKHMTVLHMGHLMGKDTRDLIFSLDYMLHYISQYFTLQPGDLIWTGTMGSTRSTRGGGVS